MIEEMHTFQVTCDTDRKRLKLVESARCHGAGPRVSSLADAREGASREGFVLHKDGKHHLCGQCALLNPEAAS